MNRGVGSWRHTIAAMKAIVLSVGDELVLGQTVDTNSAWISQQLATIGISVFAHATVGDAQEDIEAALRSAIAQADAVIVSGGIGPTADDVTRQALAVVMDVPLEVNDAWLEHMRTWFQSLGRVMPETNSVQALIPRGATMIWNHNGTAAGVAAKIGKVSVFLTPGVPKEMKGMFTRDVLPALASAGGGAAIVQRTLHTFGAGESTIAEKLGNLMKRGRNPSVGTTVAGGVVSVRVNSRFDTAQEATTRSDGTCAEIRAALGDLIYGEDNETLPAVVATLLFDNERAKQWSPAVATVESCTGGLLAGMLTQTPGSSAYFRQGWVTYTNQAKMDQLGHPAVMQESIEAHGAVSEPVAAKMATGGGVVSGAYFTLAITGIAGPGGGTGTKPVGTVCIALAAGDRVAVRTFIFPGDRDMIRDRAAKMALTMLRFELLGKPLPL